MPDSPPPSRAASPAAKRAKIDPDASPLRHEDDIKARPDAAGGAPPTAPAGPEQTLPTSEVRATTSEAAHVVATSGSPPEDHAQTALELDCATLLKHAQILANLDARFSGAKDRSCLQQLLQQKYCCQKAVQSVLGMLSGGIGQFRIQYVFMMLVAPGKGRKKWVELCRTKPEQELYLHAAETIGNRLWYVRDKVLPKSVRNMKRKWDTRVEDKMLQVLNFFWAGRDSVY